jgi:RES domain-containing protein
LNALATWIRLWTGCSPRNAALKGLARFDSRPLGTAVRPCCTAWRLCNKSFAELTGEGARLYGARWNPKGYAIVYASECLPLATLEALVYIRRRPDDQVYIQLSFDDALVRAVEALYPLPAGWNSEEAATQQSGATG